MSTSVITKKRLVTSKSTAVETVAESAADEPESTAPDGAGGGPPAEPPAGSRFGGRTPLVGVALLVVLLLAAVGYLWFRLDDSRAEVDRLETAKVTQAEVLERARDLAVALTTYDYRDLEAQQRLLEEGTTDAFQQKFAETNETLAPMFTQLEASAQGTVVDAAVQKVDGDLATVLVFADQSASSTQSEEPTSQASRLRLHLVRHGGTWLLDSVDLL
ncbi:hypothetical protein KVF89_04540 [Nocardioides carbamazepini]|uniref:hypothetical protein n=1 Tax=Nocardioides carbamazepini TaxID=2854259 RepID=UPI00214A5831|nr:hypothetical protein [Nocardioides carbamazepini]MCR1781796.1 hypothetical protein [Nocardioides carbamazepini]